MILQKMNKSQLQDLGIVNEQLGLAQQETENIKTQLGVCKVLAEKQAEEIAALTRIKKRVQTASYFELGIGTSCLIFGCLPIWTDSQKNIQNLFLGIGAAGTLSGAASFAFTFSL